MIMLSFFQGLDNDKLEYVWVCSRLNNDYCTLQLMRFGVKEAEVVVEAVINTEALVLEPDLLITENTSLGKS